MMHIFSTINVRYQTSICLKKEPGRIRGTTNTGTITNKNVGTFYGPQVKPSLNIR
uniref:Uncharacterized protein n=1 Tax=Arundo donax TaxID=35708 RepID=A0A0A9AFW9_ARUDO